MSEEFIEAYLAAIETALLLIIPPLLILTAYSWVLALRKKPYRIPIFLATSNTIVGAGATYLAWTVLYRARIGVVPIELLPVTATVIVMLCVVPFITTVYLAILEARRD